MAIATGTRLGPYEITGSLGAGGMGEVYRARDTRLDRTVAIKVLPELFATDPTFRARFDREARAISALNHPHICTLHDVGAEGRTAYLVMEHVNGQPVEGPMPAPRAIAAAIQICDALEAAHGAGIIHRDLKPSNILISKSSPPQIKLLDFGLAMRPAAHADAAAEATISALTIPHTIVGTPQYMSPEQIEGREADARSDIFALGCVLYELITGKHAFEGNSPSSVMAAILATEPRPLRELMPITPPALEWIVTRCLAKNPDDRWQTVRDLRASLERLLHDLATPAVAPAPARASRLPWLAAAVAALVAIAAGAVAVAIYRRQPAPDTRVFVSDFVAPTTPTGPPALRLSISPDGRRIAYIAPDANGRLALWIHNLDTLSAQPLAGTLNATAPFWSPDSRAIAFLSGGKLKRIDASGGAVTTICDASTGPPGTWNKYDVILFTGLTTAITRVSASGGKPEPVLKVEDKHGPRLQIAPVFLPDNRHFIYASAVPGAGVREIYLASIDSTETTILLSDATSNVMYASGYILYLRDTMLMARPFDTTTLKFSGDAIPLVEQIQVNPTTGTGAFTVSRNGVLAYQTSTGGGGTTLAWFDRTGRKLGDLGDRGGYLDVQLSRDGTRASVTRPIENGTLPDVWVYDVARKLPARLTFGKDRSAAAVYSPDGTRLIYAVQRDPGSVLLEKLASGAGEARVVLEDQTKNLHPVSWSPDGKFLLYEVVTRSMVGSLSVLPLAGDQKPYPFLNSGFSEVPGVFSPDGKWVAYVSTQSSDRKEVFITAFQQPAGVWQVSTSGGDFPRWRRDSKELFFLATDKLMSASISIAGDQVKVGDVKPLFDVRWPVGTRAVYDVAPDGQKFLMNVWDAGASLPITVMINWTAKLGR
jgi:serine/threonine protein kinase